MNNEKISSKMRISQYTTVDTKSHSEQNEPKIVSFTPVVSDIFDGLFHSSVPFCSVTQSVYISILEHSVKTKLTHC